MAVSLGEERLNESPLKEDLALLHIRKNMQLPSMMVRKAIKAGRADDWS